MYNRRVMPLCSKTLRKKTDPESLALFPTGPPQLNPATTTTTTTIWIRLLLLRYVFAAGTRSSVRLYFVCLFPCIQSTRANVFWKQSLRCLVVCKSPPLTEIDRLRQFTTPSSFQNRFSSYRILRIISINTSCRIIRASRQILPLKEGFSIFIYRWHLLYLIDEREKRYFFIFREKTRKQKYNKTMENVNTLSWSSALSLR